MAFVKKNHRNHIATGFLATLMNERGNLSVTPPTEPPIGTPPRRGLPRWISNLWTRLVISTQNVYQGIVLQRSIDRFYLVFGGHIFFETLYAAVEFDLFSRLEDEPGLSTQEIATRLGIEAQPARILLLGLTSVKFLKKSGDHYFNTTLTKKLLTKKSPLNVLDYVRLQHHGMYKAMPHFVDALKTYSNVGLKEFPGTAPTFYQRLSSQPPLEKIFQDAMQQLSVQTNALFANNVDLSDVKHLVDVGGGDGTNLMTLARAHPHLRGTVFDFPSVCEIARKNIAAHHLSDRVGTVAGHCFENPFPTNADAFLFSHFFTIWSKEKDLQLLKKAFAALPSGGRAMIFNMMQNDDGTGPLSAAVGSPYFLTLATGEGMLYTWSEYEDLFRKAGFFQVKRIVLTHDHGVIMGVKP
jgi:ubiquinone/menaquinone biosynthesis C-methylase UbiE